MKVIVLKTFKDKSGTVHMAGEVLDVESARGLRLISQGLARERVQRWTEEKQQQATGTPAGPNPEPVPEPEPDPDEEPVGVTR